MVKHIAYIKDQQIINLQTAYGRLPEQGVRDDGILVVHLDFPIENGLDFINRYYFDDGKFHSREEKPNDYARWSSENRSWEWSVEDFISEVRSYRNRLLSLSDWTRMDDNGLDDDDRELWAIYRQELRDLPESLDGIESLNDVPWPTPPQ
jgi:cyclopropane fatty-acyl-phospholipid synthase-like methyltransferase